MPVVTLLTDFGQGDYYVAAVKGTLLRLAPGVQLVDLSHDIEPANIAAAAYLLGAAVPTFPAETVHLAVVDPGVGSERRILVVEAAGGRGGRLVGPDNGLFTPLLDGARVWTVERQDLFLTAPGATFHGRDRFAPVAAHLLRGGTAGDLGPEIADPVRLPHQPPRQEATTLTGRVVHVDRFGNLVTDIPAAWLPAGGSPPPQIVARVGSHTASCVAAHYAAIPGREAALLVGSQGTIELAMRGEDLARRWGVGSGAAVLVRWR
jgi:S-adenosylmethionine hydrolase